MLMISLALTGCCASRGGGDGVCGDVHLVLSHPQKLGLGPGALPGHSYRDQTKMVSEASSKQYFVSYEAV